MINTSSNPSIKFCNIFSGNTTLPLSLVTTFDYYNYDIDNNTHKCG